MTVRCYLAPSIIEGLGVFTTYHISQGEIIWQFDPEFDQVFPIGYPKTQPNHIREFLERYTYVHPNNPRLIVLDSDEGKFMNHDDAPNTDYSNPEIGVALRDINAGEELTCDYRQFTIGPLKHQPPRHRVSLLPIAAPGSRRFFYRGH